MKQDKTTNKTTNKTITWKLVSKNIDDLKAHDNNPRVFTEKGMKDLEQSIKSVGFFQPIAINTDGTILSGHARLMKLKDLGEKQVDVMIPDRTLTAKQEEEVLVRANANTAGKWDFDILANQFEIEELQEWGLEIPKIDVMNEEEISSFFNNVDDNNNLDSKKNNIVLEYTEEEYNLILKEFSKYKGKSKEKVVWELFGL